MVDQEIQPEEAPALHFPRSNSIVQVDIINSTTDIVVPAERVVDQVLKGQENLNLPTYVFLIENKAKGKSILFDCGSRKDWWNLSPVTSISIKEGIPALNVVKNVSEILAEGGVDTKTINSIIWSHWHWDHIGNAALFDQSTEIVVGPGFKDALLPGYPAKIDSPVLEADFEYEFLLLSSLTEFSFSIQPLVVLKPFLHYISRFTTLLFTNEPKGVALSAKSSSTPKTELANFPATISSVMAASTFSMCLG